MASVVPSPAVLNARLTSEKIDLETRLRVSNKEVRDLRQKNAKLVDHVSQLEETQRELHDHLRRLLGGRGTPTLSPGQGLLFTDSVQELTSGIEDLIAPEAEELPEVDAADADVPDAENDSDPAPKKPRPRDRRKIDESNLRREVRRTELPPEERRCPETGVALIETGVKVSTELSYQSAELFLIEHHQVIYGPAPEVEKERKIEPLVAPHPPTAIEGVTATASLLAWLLCQKYVLHLPLYRQEDAFARLGVRLSRKTLCDWVMKCAFAFSPVVREIERQIRAGPVLQLDDTRIKVKRPGPGGGKEKYRQSYLWVFENPAVSGVVFRFSEGRSTNDLAAILGPGRDNEAIEVMVGDGYQANRSGAREAGWDVRHAGCWAHLLRKFRDALNEAPQAMGLFMKDIADLYAIEAQAKKDGLGPDELLELRRLESMPIAVGLMRLTSNWRESYSLEGNVAKAMTYARNQRHALLEFLRDGRVPIDNNACERAIRPLAVGRHNWQFAGSVEGAEAAAILYSMVESAKASGVDPLAYLEAVLERHGQWPSSDIDRLTPWAMASELPGYRARSVQI